MQSKSSDNETRRAKVTPEHQEESRRLLSIWNRMKPTLVARGYGTQEAFGAMFSVGNQAAVGHFLHGRSAISMKAAVAFAQGLECKVSDFSPRLAALLHEDAHAERAPRSAGPHAVMPSLEFCLGQVAHALQAAPDRVREQMGKELALLASVPDSQTLVSRIATALSPFANTRGATAGTSYAAPGLVSALARRLDTIGDARERERLFAVLDATIDREMEHPSDGVKAGPASADRPSR